MAVAVSGCKEDGSADQRTEFNIFAIRKVDDGCVDCIYDECGQVV
jgi:hypothetical protein